MWADKVHLAAAEPLQHSAHDGILLETRTQLAPVPLRVRRGIGMDLPVGHLHGLDGKAACQVRFAQAREGQASGEVIFGGRGVVDARGGEGPVDGYGRSETRAALRSLLAPDGSGSAVFMG